MAEERKPRGLVSINEARQLREKRSQPAASGRFWLWSLVAIGVMSIFYWRKSVAEADAQRTRILARERQLKAEVGGTFYSIRDRVEQWTMKTAKDDWDVDFIDLDFQKESAGASEPIFQRGGIYLRIGAPDAVSPERIRKAARDSLRDAFTACLVRTPHLDVHEGKPCKRSKDCEKGQICNEVDVCGTPQPPYNMRTIYKGMRVLSEDWVRDVETSSEELRLRLFEMDIDDAFANDVAVAKDMIAKSRYFLVVVDEIPPGTQPEDGGTVEQAVQSEVHGTKVALYDLESSKLLARIKRKIDVTIPVVPGSIEAQRRQVLNCALADDVRAAIKGK